MTLNSNSISGQFADKNVATNKPVAIIGLSLGGVDAGNYSVIDNSGAQADITARPLTVEDIQTTQPLVNDKVYDGTTTATLNLVGASFIGGLNGDDIRLDTTNLSASFADKHVGQGKQVTASGITLTGGDAGNYYIADYTAGIADITAKPVTSTGITAQGKVYDASTLAQLDTSNQGLSGIVAGDLVTLNSDSASGNFADKHAGANKGVTILGLILSGPDAANYSLLDASGATADITSRPLTVDDIQRTQPLVNDKVYDGTTTASLNLTGATFVGGLSGDSIWLDTSNLSVSFADKNVGQNKRVTATGITLAGSDATNYYIADYTAGTADITPKSITINGLTALDKVYDGNLQASLDTSSATLSGVLEGDDLSLNVSSLSGTFSDKNVASNKSVTIQGVSASGSDITNYSLLSVYNTQAAITARTLTSFNITANSRVYDGSSSVTLNTGAATFGGLVASDDVTLEAAAAQGTLADKNAGNNRAVSVSGLTLSGSDAVNYQVVDGNNASATISQLAITATGLVALDKAYDASTITSIDASAAQLNGVLAGDELSLDSTSLAGQFSDKNSDTGKPVTISILSLNGADATNYSITDASNALADITPKDLTLSGLTAGDKIYDGNTTATSINQASALFNGLVGSESLTLASGISGTFNAADVADAHTVTFSGITLLDGNNGGEASNYKLVSWNTDSSRITAKTLTLSGETITAANKVYDHTTDATLTISGYSLEGVVHGEDVTLNSTVRGHFSDWNAGVGKPVTYSESDFTLSGTDTGNYQLDSSDFAGTTTADIIPYTLTLNFNALDKAFDGTTEVTVTATHDGYSMDDLLLSYSSNFLSPQVGLNKPVSIWNITLGGVYASNYQLTSTTASTTASITGSDPGYISQQDFIPPYPQQKLTEIVTVSSDPWDVESVRLQYVELAESETQPLVKPAIEAQEQQVTQGNVLQQVSKDESPRDLPADPTEADTSSSSGGASCIIQSNQRSRLVTGSQCNSK